MRGLLTRYRHWRARRAKLFHVLLRYEDGGTWVAGPMTHFGAELFIVHRLWPEQRGRRVVSARIVQP